jgi:hypothetical protein
LIVCGFAVRPYRRAPSEGALALSPARSIAYIREMIDTPDAQHRQPEPSGVTSGDAIKVLDVLGKLGDLPEGVKRVSARFGEDSQGDPAVWITFTARDDLKPSKEKIADLLRVAEEVRSEVIRSGIESWPYVEIATE